MFLGLQLGLWMLSELVIRLHQQRLLDQGSLRRDTTTTFKQHARGHTPTTVGYAQSPNQDVPKAALIVSISSRESSLCTGTCERVSPTLISRSNAAHQASGGYHRRAGLMPCDIESRPCCVTALLGIAVNNTSMFRKSSIKTPKRELMKIRSLYSSYADVPPTPVCIPSNQLRRAQVVRVPDFGFNALRSTGRLTHPSP